MATGASTCDLAIILIDARHGVQTQTRRHSYIASLLGIRHFIIAVNKMDLIEDHESTFKAIRANYLAFAEKLHIPDIHFIPISALKGDNVVHPSSNMPWFAGEPLMTLLDTIDIRPQRIEAHPRFPIQYINRPHLNFRGYSGTLASGRLKQGDPIKILPSGKTSQIAKIIVFEGELEAAEFGQAITVTLTDEIDISRGDLLVRSDEAPEVGQTLRAHLVWMSDSPLIPNRPYLFKQNSRLLSGTVSCIHHRIDVNTQVHHPTEALQINEIGQVEVVFSAPIAFDPYSRCKVTGSFIVIDRMTNATVGAGLIIAGADKTTVTCQVDQTQLEQRLGQRGKTLWLDSARANLIELLEARLFQLGYIATRLAPQDEHYPSIEVCVALNRAALIVLAITPPAPTPIPIGKNHQCVPDHLTAVEAIITWMSDQEILLL